LIVKETKIVIESAIDLLTRASLRFKWVVIALAILVLVGGIFAITELNQELLPKIEFPQTILMALNPGASAEEMRDQVSIPMEEAISGFEDVVNIESTSYNGVSVVVVKSDFGVDLEDLRKKIQTALDEINFPDGMETPEMLTFSFSDIPLAAIGASSPELSLDELKNLVEGEIVPAIEGVEGVANVEVSGGQELPTLPPPTVEPTEEPTLEPTAEPSPTPTEEPTVPAEPAGEDGVPLPDTWKQAGAAQNVSLETTNDLTPAVIEGIVSFAPQMLQDLTPEMLLAMPIDALAALPEDYLLTLDTEIQAQLLERLSQVPGEVEAIPLPDSWIQAAAAQNVILETTQDLTPEMVGGIVDFAPQMLEDLTPEMLLAMPLDALAAMPEAYLQSLDPELQAQLLERLSQAAGEAEPVPLPDSWIQAAAAQNVTLETTDDLTPEIVGAMADFMPQMLEDLTPEMLLAMPVDALAAIPESYIETLDVGLQEALTERLAAAPEPEDSGTLPSSWKAAGQAQGLSLEYPEDVTVEIFQGISGLAPQLLRALTPDNLRRFSPEVLGWFPQDFIQSLDETLRTELDTLAAPVGGLGALAAQAEAEAEALAASAPELSGLWREEPEDTTGVFPTFETAADLFTTGFTDSAAELLNLLLDSGQPQAPQLLADLTPDVIQWLAENEDNFLEKLSPSVLRLLSPEVLGSLPESFMETLDADLRSELEGIAAGTAEAFIPTNTINRIDGNPSLGLVIYKDGEANTVSTAHIVYDKLDELEAANPGLRFDIAFEQATFVEESITGVAREGGLGALFAVVVILIFLSGMVRGKYQLSWRSTFVTAVSIPLSVLMAFAALKWLPPAANSVLQPLADGTESIPVLGAITGVFLRLFPIGITLNIMTLSGMTVAVGRVVDDSIVVLENIYRHIQRGEELKSSVIVGTRDVAIAILASTVTTVVVFLPIGLLGGIVGELFLPFGVTVTFALASSFLVAVTIVPVLAYIFIRKEHLPPEGETNIQRWYTPVLEWALKHRGLTLGIAGVLLATSLFILGQRPQAFLPDFGEVQINVSVDLPNGVAMSETNDAVIAFENQLENVVDLGTVQSEIGSSGGLASRLLGGAIDQSTASISIGVSSTSKIDPLTAEVRQIAEDSFGVENVVVSSGSLTSSAFGGFSLVLSGDPEELAAFNDQAIAELDKVEGLTNVTSNLMESGMILRVDGEPAVQYTGELETEDSLGVTETAKARLESIVPSALTVSEGFETEQQTKGFQQALRAIMISILAVYLVMVLTFRSFVHPFTILFSLPLAIIGAAIALWITNRVVGISVLVGLMMLVGIVVTNAIVLIDRVQTNRKKRNMDVYDALVEGGRTRLRPILMTAIAAMLALLPLALGFTEGALIAAELATVVIGGLFTSTLLTLVVVPVMYSLLTQLTTRKQAPVVEENK
jgi:multidrug efflux pump subunit AcrB